MHVDDLPAAIFKYKHAAFVVCVVADAAVLFYPGKHESVADHGCISINLHTRLE